MGTYDRRALLDRQQMRGDRASNALARRRRRHRVDEPFARGPNQKRQTQALELSESGKTDDALLRRLPEPNAWIEHDVVARDAGALRNLQRAGKKGQHIRDDVYR